MRTAFVLVVGLLFVAAISGVAAEPDEHTAPLDRGYEKVGETTVDGTTYDVYRYDNLLPHASGYEFFDGDRRVGDADEARRVSQAYAWKVAVTEEMDENDIEKLRDVGRTADRAGTVVSAPFTVLDTTLSYIDELDERQVPFADRSFWDVATSTSPEVRGIESALRTSRNELERWDERVGEVGEDVTRVADESERIRGSDGSDYDDLPRLFEDASDGLKEAEEVSGVVADDLGEASERTGSIADDLAEVRLVGDELSSPFSRLSSALGNATTTVEEFGDSAAEAREVVERTNDRAATEESGTSTGWNRRQNAALRVYGTAAAVAVVVLLTGGYAYRRRD